MNENNGKLIQFLSCAYSVHQQNSYIMGLFGKWDLASFNQKWREN